MHVSWVGDSTTYEVSRSDPRIMLASSPSSGDLKYACRHTFFDGPLPGGDEYDASHDASLLTQCHVSSAALLKIAPDTSKAAIQAGTNMLNSLAAVLTASGHVNETALHERLLALTDPWGAGTVPVHVRAQNAGLLFTRQGDVTMVQAFESIWVCVVRSCRCCS
jgi:hypothetical protein